ncbi:hypothetical protein JJB09_13430 [Rhizobium sp. KVB221]|uniref:Bacterial transcriptional activator domain-containing protein n=1 Tax=Rhizobium setariae TaxID=2801340 RepID=A0A936YR42_9HYPH|nr:BTAD domain-containing putative transcriptional regulator [Rhizobium setariae]MBL0373031.1 hypothetical protein [Rhizobium setariae]
MGFVLRLFGRFQLLAATGESIAIGSRKHQALIAMLALSNGRPISRSKLAGTLWAERTEDHARNSLRQAFFTIRHAMEGHGAEPFMFDNEAGWVQDGELVTDVQALVAAAASGLLPERLDYYEGEFLEGLNFSDETLEVWLRSERDRHHDLLFDCLMRIANSLEKSGDKEQAVAAARCLLRHDPYHEPSHRIVLRNYLSRGERARAIRYYETLGAQFKADLDVIPDAETRQLIAGIRNPRDPTQRNYLASGKPRLAILPIVSLSDRGDDSHVAESLTRKLIGEVGRFSPISVVAAATMLAFKAREHTVEEIGALVSADYILEIAFQGLGETGWTLAQLVSVHSGTQIWSRKYSGENATSMAGQDRLVRKISGNLFQILMKHASESSSVDGAEKVTDGNLYLKVFHHVERPTLTGMIRARRLCNRILTIDPDHVLVRESLAWINFHSSFNGWLGNPIRAFMQARDIVTAGLQIDDREPYLLSAFGLAETYLGNIRAGLDGLTRAVDLNPNDGEFHTWLGIGLTYADRIEEAHAAFDQADQVSPDYHPIFLFRSDACIASGNYHDAIAFLDRFLTVLPEYNWARLLRAAAHEAIGNSDEARLGVAEVRQNNLLLNGRYIEQLLLARGPYFRERLWPMLEAAGLPWSK